jgi:hypothetical protein
MAEEKEQLSAAADAQAASQGICKEIAIKVDKTLETQCRRKQNEMRLCEGEQKPFKCGPLKLPAFTPWISIRWGDSRCDCIEGDDTEIMCLTICNPYSNVTLSNMMVHLITVVNADGSPVPNLPDGSPSIQLVPMGPYCFGDLAPCTCISRQFVLRLRGAPGKPYRIMLDGICFDACVHSYTRGCFTFDVCKD